MESLHIQILISYKILRMFMKKKRKYLGTELASEKALAEHWLTPEEDEAWKDL